MNNDSAPLFAGRFLSRSITIATHGLSDHCHQDQIREANSR